MGGRECANCGRDVRRLADARKEGGRWFCSDSCFLQHESRTSGTPPRKPRRRWRRRLGWTLAIIVSLFVGLAALGAALQTKPKRAAPGRRAHVIKVTLHAVKRSHRPSRLHHVVRAAVTIASSGYADDSGELDYGIVLLNKSPNADAVNVSVSVRAVDKLGRSVVSQNTPISVIPAGATFYLSGLMHPSVSLKVSKLNARVRIGRSRKAGLRLPEVSNVRVSKTYGGLLEVHGTLTNIYTKRSLSQNAPIYVVFLDRDGHVIGSTIDSTGAAVRPKASVSFHVEGFVPGGHVTAARVSVEACTYVRCLP